MKIDRNLEHRSTAKELMDFVASRTADVNLTLSTGGPQAYWSFDDTFLDNVSDEDLSTIAIYLMTFDYDHSTHTHSKIDGLAFVKLKITENVRYAKPMRRLVPIRLGKEMNAPYRVEATDVLCLEPFNQYFVEIRVTATEEAIRACKKERRDMLEGLVKSVGAILREESPPSLWGKIINLLGGNAAL